MYYTLHTIHYTLQLHITPYTPTHPPSYVWVHYTLHSTHYTLYITHYTLHTHLMFGYNTDLVYTKSRRWNLIISSADHLISRGENDILKLNAETNSIYWDQSKVSMPGGVPKVIWRELFRIEWYNYHCCSVGSCHCPLWRNFRNFQTFVDLRPGNLSVKFGVKAMVISSYHGRLTWSLLNVRFAGQMFPNFTRGGSWCRVKAGPARAKGRSGWPSWDSVELHSREKLNCKARRSGKPNISECCDWW